MKVWKQLTKNRKFRESKFGSCVIVPDHDPHIVPLDCDVCGYLMKDYSDTISYREAGCCSLCFMKWVEIDLENWKSGWRPSKHEVDEEIKKRIALPSIIVRYT